MTAVDQMLLVFSLPVIAYALHVADTALARRRTRRLNDAAVRAARSVRS